MQSEEQKIIQEIWESVDTEVRQEIRADIFNLFMKFRKVFNNAKYIDISLEDEHSREIFVYVSEFIKTTRV